MRGAFADDPMQRVNLDPLKLAVMAQNAIREHHAKIVAEGGIIKQLLVGRHVRHRGTGKVWKVLEVRVGLGGTATLYGVSPGKRRQPLGFLAEVELYSPEA